MLVGRAARFVGQEAVQLHGGVGVTDELNVSHYFKRLTTLDALFGDATITSRATAICSRNKNNQLCFFVILATRRT
jgi:alkylation response protein AidB-like acyl-CoA dehydrogenase